MQVMRRIYDEDIRGSRYLHRQSKERLMLECQTWLLCEENIDFITEGSRAMISREQWQGLLVQLRFTGRNHFMLIVSLIASVLTLFRIVRAILTRYLELRVK
jgi:hypothetical protein